MSDIPSIELGRFKAVAIGSSTGGPGLLEEILKGLPADLPLPVFVAQHMPPTFTESFANRLQLSSPLTVVHAQDAMPVLNGTAYIGKGHHHMRVCRTRQAHPNIEVNKEPQELVYKPSADELFRSCAAVYGDGVLAVILSGIGRDGTEGARAVRQAGGMVLTQLGETCAVNGMPRSCVEAGQSDAQLKPDQIRRTILQLSPDYREQALAETNESA